MAESKIVTFVIFVWKTLVSWYEASVLARTINAVCDFFKKKAADSVAVRAFMHGILNGKWWQNSLSCRFLSLLVSGRKCEKKKSSGAVLDAALDIFNIPLRSVGLVTLSFALPMLLIGAIGGNTLNIAVSAALALLGVLCLVFSRSTYELYLGSAVLRFIGKLFYDGEYKAPVTRKIPLLPVCTVGVILGTVGGLVSPLLTTVIIIGVLFAAVVLARFEVGVYTTLFLAAFLPTSATAALCVLTIAGFAAALWSGRKGGFKPSALAPLLAIYVILGAFSTATSFDIGGSAFIYAVYLVFIAMYCVLVNTLDSVAKWRAAVVTFALSALLIALLGIVQNFTMDVTTQSWVDTNMFEDIKIRVYATFDNPNVLGQYFIITIPIIFALFVYAKRFCEKTAWLAVFGVTFLCLLYTWSRGAWVGVMLGVAVFLLIRDRRWIVLCILAVLAMPFVLPPSILNRLLSIGNTGDSSTAYRVSVWIASARMAFDFWMSGVGYGSDAFANVYSSYALNGAGYALHAHNFYIQLVADVGIGGLLVYIAIAMTAYREIATVKNDRFIKTVSLALAGVLAGYLFQGVAESMWYNMRMSLMFWIVMAFIVSGAKIDRGSAEC
ncbi:MAG: O-antigen ligase family protein [Clostridia bacterium]|nr:O-antigen ligase family protein [Clostridia bacterium]